jgi:hypothetical protein
VTAPPQQCSVCACGLGGGDLGLWLAQSRPDLVCGHDPLRGLTVTVGIVGGGHPAVSELHAKGSTVVEIADEEAADLPIASGLPEDLAVLPGTVRAQQLALALALGRGLDPDAPFGLRKVTPMRAAMPSARRARRENQATCAVRRHTRLVP